MIMEKILIVEDDQIVANIYRNKFSTEGFQVEVARDGHKGLELAGIFRPDLMILDLMLPGLTGVELMKQVRALPEFKEVPIIVFSSTYLANMVQEAWKAGATKCLSKVNCSPRQLVEIARNTLKSRASSKAPAASIDSTPPFAGEDKELALQNYARSSFIEELPAKLATLRTTLALLAKSDTPETRLKQIRELCQTIHMLTGPAGIAGFARIAAMSDALEALLKELFEKPKHINPSTLRTVATSIDFLCQLCTRVSAADAKDLSNINILVVDDEAISRRAITHALEKAKLKSVGMEDPEAAYDLLIQNRFDLIFLDVDMPGMNGFELCAKLRALPSYQKTPVVFVTSLNDFESRANSTMSGGNDFIGKPFMFIELAVKALVYVLRGRMDAEAGT